MFEVIWPCAFVVHDGRSKNGTFVNENNLGKGGKQGLQHGDKITLGEVNFVFVTTDPNDNSKQPKHSSHSSLSSNRLSRGNNQTVSTAATTVHQVGFMIMMLASHQINWNFRVNSTLVSQFLGNVYLFVMKFIKFGENF